MYLNIPIAEKNAITIEEADKYNKNVQTNKKAIKFTDPLQQFDRIGRFKPKILSPKIIFKLLICRKNYHYFN